MYNRNSRHAFPQNTVSMFARQLRKQFDENIRNRFAFSLPASSLSAFRYTLTEETQQWTAETTKRGRNAF